MLVYGYCKKISYILFEGIFIKTKKNNYFKHLSNGLFKWKNKRKLHKHLLKVN